VPALVPRLHHRNKSLCSQHLTPLTAVLVERSQAAVVIGEDIAGLTVDVAFAETRVADTSYLVAFERDSDTVVTAVELVDIALGVERGTVVMVRMLACHTVRMGVVVGELDSRRSMAAVQRFQCRSSHWPGCLVVLRTER
jgi:hypothetical protein